MIEYFWSATKMVMNFYIWLIESWFSPPFKYAFAYLVSLWEHENNIKCMTCLPINCHVSWQSCSHVHWLSGASLRSHLVCRLQHVVAYGCSVSAISRLTHGQRCTTLLPYFCPATSTMLPYLNQRSHVALCIMRGSGDPCIHPYQEEHYEGSLIIISFIIIMSFCEFLNYECIVYELWKWEINIYLSISILWNHNFAIFNLRRG